MTAKRQSNFELLRILAMLMVVLLHMNVFVLGGVTQDDVIANPLQAFARQFFDQLCCICVDLFILISGWFGIRTKAKGFFSIIFQVVFYTAVISILFYLMGLDLPFEKIKKSLTFDNAYWFIPQYLILYLIAPILNNFVEKSDSKQIISLCASLFVFEFIFEWNFHYAGLNGGYSAISFIPLYVTTRYLATHDSKIKSKSRIFYFLLFIVLTLVPTIIGFTGAYYINNDLGKAQYTSPFVILSALSLFLFFSKLNFYSKTLNWLACSSFSIYLIHISPITAAYFKQYMTVVYLSVSNFVYPIVALCLAIIIAVVCVLFDKIRILLWRITDVIFDKK